MTETYPGHGNDTKARVRVGQLSSMRKDKYQESLKAGNSVQTFDGILQGDNSVTKRLTRTSLRQFYTRLRAKLWRWRRCIVAVVILLVLYIVLSQLRPPCLWPHLLLKRFSRLDDRVSKDVTIVTGYFNLGHVPKASNVFSLYTYLTWAGVFQHIQNPLVVYTDSEQVQNMFLESRRHLANSTLVVRVSRSQLASFRRVEEIRRVFSSRGYPKFPPNTVIAEYPCTQHAKYELVKDAIDKGYFPWTKYIAWVDLGYFRYLTGRKRNFWMVAPPDMDESQIAMTEVQRPDFRLQPDDVFKKNLLWVGGGMSVGRRGVYGQFVVEFLQAASDFLDNGLSNTDQQVLYGMFTDAYRRTHNVTTRIQTYTWLFNSVHTCWFHLGYLCYRED